MASSGSRWLTGHRATWRKRRLPCPRATPSEGYGARLRRLSSTIPATRPWPPTPRPSGPPIDQSNRMSSKPCQGQSARCPMMYRGSDSGCRSRGATRLRYLEPLSTDSEQVPTWRARTVRFRYAEPRESNDPRLRAWTFPNPVRQRARPGKRRGIDHAFAHTLARAVHFAVVHDRRPRPPAPPRSLLRPPSPPSTTRKVPGPSPTPAPESGHRVRQGCQCSPSPTRYSRKSRRKRQIKLHLYSMGPASVVLSARQAARASRPCAERGSLARREPLRRNSQ